MLPKQHLVLFLSDFLKQIQLLIPRNVFAAMFSAAVFYCIFLFLLMVFFGFNVLDSRGWE